MMGETRLILSLLLALVTSADGSHYETTEATTSTRTGQGATSDTKSISPISSLTATYTEASRLSATDIRLMDGHSLSSQFGRVEVYYEGQWGTVCDDSFDHNDAMVVCRMLGFSTQQVYAYGSALYGQGNGTIVIDDLDCTGHETTLSDCRSRPWMTHNCQHSEDAGVECRSPRLSATDIRLMDGHSLSSQFGRVEVYYEGQWGTVCDNSFDHNDAMVVCRMLGFSTQQVYAYGSAHYGQGTGTSFIDELNCAGHETTLSDCRSSPWMTNECSHAKDAGVDCRYFDYETTELPTPATECSVTSPADIVFVLDASGSVGSANFQAMLSFINRLVDYFPVNQNEVHIGLVTYDNSAHAQFNLNAYYDKQTIKNVVLGISYTGGGTQTDVALSYVRQTAFSSQYGARTNAAKIAIIITDGESSNPPATIDEAARLRNAGVTIFSIGVGNAEINELNSIATDPDSTHVFQVTNFASLDTIRHALTTKACQATVVSVVNAITVGCNEYGWNVTVDMHILRQIQPNALPEDIYMGENSCTGTYTGVTLNFRQGMRECLTSEQIVGNTLMYINELVYAEHDLQHSYIIRHYNWTVSIECDVDRNNTASGQIHHDSHEPSGHQVVGSSEYAVNMSFYQDPNYLHVIPGNPLHVKVGTQVYVKVYTQATDWTIKMRVHSCYTKPTSSSPDNMKYYLIKNGCEVDRNTHIISQSTHETRFVFQDFEYTTNHEGIFVYCDTTFCGSNDYSQECTQICNPNSKRSVANPSGGEDGGERTEDDGEHVTSGDPEGASGKIPAGTGISGGDVPQLERRTVWRQIIHTK